MTLTKSDPDEQVITSDLPESIDVPVVYRDFQPSTHPDFESHCCGLVTGMIKPNLAADGTPDFLSIGSPQMITSAASLFDWYHDSAKSKVIVSKLTMAKQLDDSYVYDNSSFFPLDGLGWGNEGNPHNFHFTSELRYYFTFKGGEVLDFRGDDDGTNAGGYGKCAAGCVLGPRCGDGVLQADQGEQCDDGNLVGGDGCSAACKTDIVVPK